MKVEFFHSVLCGHCFIMSDRIREITEEYPEIEIIHRSYPLRWDDSEDQEKFESEEAFKTDMERKWKTANRIDDKHRFNIKAMQKMPFKMPTARRSMIAIQAGVLAGGDEWELFDRFQEALYVEVRNIDNEDVIADILIEMGIDFAEFLKHYEDPRTEEMVMADFQKADDYGLTLIPALVVEEKHVIEGTKRKDLVVELLKEAAKEEGYTIFQ